MRKVLSAFFVFSVFIYSVTIGAVSLGDKFLIENNISQATAVYTAGSSINPLSQKLAQRLIMTRVITEDLKGMGEESSEHNKELALIKSQQKVLGAHTTLPVLMYHYIRINPWPDDKVGFGLSVTPYMFDKQMEYLQIHGYHALSIDDFENILLYNKEMPEKPILITFDDGYRDAYTEAYPILKKHNLKGVNFVITGFVGGPIYLTWDEIDEMEKSGVFSFASHTVNHFALTYGSDEKIMYELTKSKKDLETHLGHEIRWIAYPYGNVDAHVMNLVPKAGYKDAFGTNSGTYQSESILYTLPRIRIGGGDSVESFAAKLPWK